MSKRFVAGLGLLATFAGGVVGPLAHLALVPHSRCAQHGELIHGTVTPASTTSAKDTPELSAAPAGDDDDHDHCFAQGQQRTLQAAAVGRLVVAAAIAVDAHGAAHPARSAVELLQLAPKASPPV